MNGKRNKLLLICESYPFSGASEVTFLEPEIPYLLESFDEVVLAPERIEGKNMIKFERITIDTSLSEAYKSSRYVLFVRSLMSLSFWVELFGNLELFLHPVALWRMAIFEARSQIAFQWLRTTLKRDCTNPKNLIVYTYWLYHSANGFARAKHECPDLKVISRAHGVDLYENRHLMNYIPFRHYTVKVIDHIYPDSQKGTDYLQSKWQLTSESISTARLGIEPAGFITQKSTDNILRIVSCSSITKVKRLDLLAKAIYYLAEQQRSLVIHWDHFGSGPLEDNIRHFINVMPNHIKCRLHGQLSISDIMNWYKNKPVDVFVNTSSSEGIPVSIIEASSCGIPIIATNVGGNSEAVSYKNGILISSNPTIEEIADALSKFSLYDVDTQAFKQESLNLWRSRFVANKNYREFIDQIKC